MEQESFSTSNENRHISFVKRVRIIRHNKRKHQVNPSKDVEKLRGSFQSSQYHFAKTSSNYCQVRRIQKAQLDIDEVIIHREIYHLRLQNS